MSKPLNERSSLTQAATATSDSRIKVQAITAGLGSSGYYSPEVLEKAATDKLIDRGTFLHIDHPSNSERHDRPERSVSTIAGVFVDAATYSDGALVGEVQLFEPYRERLMEMAPYIGLSISGSATDITEGEVDGKQVAVIEALHTIDSVDFVTKAGRGGQVLMECAKPSDVKERAIARGVAEATADERREQLSDAVRTAYGSDKNYAWVRDFDDDLVWFEAAAEDEAHKTWQQSYTVAEDDLSVALTGARTSVRALTTYVPTTRSDNPTTKESEEDIMGKIQIEEADHSALVEKAGRVPTLESERDTAIRERDDARRTLSATQKVARATVLIGETAAAEHVQFSQLEARGLLADLPAGDDGNLDEAAFTQAVKEAAAAKAQAGGAGTITGFGSTTTSTSVSEVDAANAVAAAFGRQVKEA